MTIEMKMNLCVLIGWRDDATKHTSEPMLLDHKAEQRAIECTKRGEFDTVELSLLKNGGTMWLASYKGGHRVSQGNGFDQFMVMPVSKMKDHLYDLQNKHQKLWEDFEKELTDSMILRNSAERSDDPQSIIDSAREKMRTARERYEKESRKLFEPLDDSDY
jgi:hypothetical protein